MNYIWNDEDLSQAFIEFGKEKGVTLYPETTMALALEVRGKVESGLQLRPSIKETIFQLFPKEEGSNMEHPISQLEGIKANIYLLLTKLAASPQKPITQQEIETWRAVIQDKIYVPFEKVAKNLTNEVRRAMDHIAAKTNEKRGIMELRGQVQALLMKAMENQANGVGRMKVPFEIEVISKYYPNWQRQEILVSKIISACRGEMIKIGKRLATTTGDINATHMYAIGITGTADYIKHEVESPDKFTTASGFQNYLEEMGYKIDNVSEALHGIEDDNRQRGKSGSAKWILESEFADLDTERGSNPIWQQRSISNNARKVAQVPVLRNTGTWTISMNQFMQSLTYEVMQKMVQKNIQEGGDPNQEKMKLEQAVKQVSVMIDALNSREDTWQKGLAIYRLLDPALQQTRDMVTQLLDGKNPETSDRKIAGGYQVSTIQPVRLTEADLKNRAKVNSIVRQYADSYATDERRWGEGQNIDAHWNTLLRLSSLQKRGPVNPYFRSAGQMFMDEAIKNNPGLKGNPELEAAARNVDIETLKEKTKDVANVIFNPSTPDWVLMKIASVGFKTQDLTGDEKEKLSEKDLKDLNEFEKQYKYLRKASYQVLKDRGWEAKRIRTKAGKSKILRESRGDEQLKAEIKRKNPNITDEELLEEVKKQSTSRKEYAIVFEKKPNTKPQATAKYQYKVIYKKAESAAEIQKKITDMMASKTMNEKKETPINNVNTTITNQLAPLYQALKQAQGREAQEAKAKAETQEAETNVPAPAQPAAPAPMA
jgi:exonuclease VII small subunit